MLFIRKKLLWPGLFMLGVFLILAGLFRAGGDSSGSDAATADKGIGNIVSGDSGSVNTGSGESGTVNTGTGDDGTESAGTIDTGTGSTGKEGAVTESTGTEGAGLESAGTGKAGTMDRGNIDDGENSGAFFVEYRLERDRNRSQQIDLLREIVNNSHSSDEIRKEAQTRLLAISQAIDTEMKLENLIRAEDFKDAVVFVEAKSVTIIVQSPVLTKPDREKLTAIAARATGLNAESIAVYAKL